MATYCIKCNTTPAYISYFGNCECSNPGCQFYSRDLYPPIVSMSHAVTEPALSSNQNKDEEEEIENSPIYQWITHHNDFGDI